MFRIFTVPVFFLVVVGCGQKPSLSTTPTVEAEAALDGMYVKFFVSKKKLHAEIEEDLKQQVEEFVNSGEWDIVDIFHARCIQKRIPNPEFTWLFKPPPICDGYEPHVLRSEVHYRPHAKE